MSWHHINREDGDEILPAILITKDNPHTFREMTLHRKNLNSKIVLIPIKNYCKTEQDVISMISKIFYDIRDKKELGDFSIKKEMRKGIGRRLLDGVILEPNFYGLGFS